MTSKWLVLAEGAIVDRLTNNLTIFNILERVASPGFPMIIPRAHIVWMLERERDEPEEISGEIAITLNGEELHRQNIAGNFEGNSRLRINILLGGLVIPDSGELSITLTTEQVEDVYTISVNSIEAETDLLLPGT